MKKHVFLYHYDFLFPHLSQLANLIKVTKTTPRVENTRMTKVRKDAKVENNERENQQNLSKEHHFKDWGKMRLLVYVSQMTFRVK